MSDAEGLLERLIGGERRALARLITLAESKRASDRERVSSVLSELRRSGMPRQALRLAFTGPPGAGKSTLIECLGSRCLGTNKVAVVAFDPSSPNSGGSLLADRTRMPDLSSRKDAFIRPSPQGGGLGGLGDAAPTLVELCEWAGYDPVIVESVGVGQGEVDARDTCDCVVLVLGPDGGDEIQGMKRGINETCDFVVINKVDVSTERAQQLSRAYQSALAVTRPADAIPEVHVTSALDGMGVLDLWKSIEAFYERARSSGTLDARRRTQRHRQLTRGLVRRFEHVLGEVPRSEAVARVEARLANGEMSLDEAIDALLRELCPEA